MYEIHFFLTSSEVSVRDGRLISSLLRAKISYLLSMHCFTRSTAYKFRYRLRRGWVFKEEIHSMRSHSTSCQQHFPTTGGGICLHISIMARCIRFTHTTSSLTHFPRLTRCTRSKLHLLLSSPTVQVIRCQQIPYCHTSTILTQHRILSLVYSALILTSGSQSGRKLRVSRRQEHLLLFREREREREMQCSYIVLRVAAGSRWQQNTGAALLDVARLRVETPLLSNTL
jgi:hypothetical protein